MSIIEWIYAAGVDIAGPGFLNITVSAGAQGVVAAQIVEAGAAYGGSGRPDQNSRVQQIAVAERVRQAEGGYGAGPVCGSR